MPTQDTSQIKERIISIIKSKGPTIPSRIASEISTSILFTSAFLSELLSEKKLKTSNMRFGNSPIYFIPGQEHQLEKFAYEHLKSKEKDAFILLKEKKFLKDSEQEPAIRVALRAIKDFAFPLKKQDELFWRYLTTSENEFEKPEEKLQEETEEPEDKEPEKEKIEKELIKEKEEPEEENLPKLSTQNKSDEQSEEHLPEEENPKEEKHLNIFDEEKKEKPKEQKKKTKKKTTPKVNEKFFNKVKEYLSENQIEISDIIGFSKSDILLKVKSNEQEYLLVSYNKKTIREEDITKAYKKAQELNLPFKVISLGEPTKKLSNFIEAIKNLKEIKKID